MIVYHCVGCRAQYTEPRAPRRCDRCHGKAFAAVDDAAAVVLSSSPGMPAELDADLAAAWARSEHFRLTGRDEPPPTPRDMPDQSHVLEGDDR